MADRRISLTLDLEINRALADVRRVETALAGIGSNSSRASLGSNIAVDASKAADSLNSVQARALALQTSFNRLGQNTGLGGLAKDAQTASTRASVLQTEIRGIQTRLLATSEPKLITDLGRQADVAKAKLGDLTRESLRLRQGAGALPGVAPATLAASRASSGANLFSQSLDTVGSFVAGGALLAIGKDLLNTAVESNLTVG